MKRLLPAFLLIMCLTAKAQITLIQFQDVATCRSWVSIPDAYRIMVIYNPSPPPGVLTRFIYDPSSSATDNGTTVIKPNIISGNGRWLWFSNDNGGAPILTAGNGIQITGTWPNQTIATIPPTINSAVTRSLNSNYTISTTQRADVAYSITCSVTNPLLAGSSTANVFLEYSTNAGSSWVTLPSVGASSAVGLTVTLQLAQGQTGLIAGTIPANALVRIRSTTTGTASATFVTGSGQEILY